MAGVELSLNSLKWNLLLSQPELNATRKKIEIEFLVIRYFPVLFFHLIKERHTNRVGGCQEKASICGLGIAGHSSGKPVQVELWLENHLSENQLEI